MYKKKILFVCVENSCRSQMAEGFANFFGEGLIDAYSAGSKPSGKVNPVRNIPIDAKSHRVSNGVNPMAIKVMREEGIDISSANSKGFAQLPLRKFDYVISMGCKDTCPFVPANKHIEWNIEDPKDKNLDFFRKVRDDIKDKVKELIQEIL